MHFAIISRQVRRELRHRELVSEVKGDIKGAVKRLTTCWIRLRYRKQAVEDVLEQSRDRKDPSKQRGGRNWNDPIDRSKQVHVPSITDFIPRTVEVDRPSHLVGF